AEAYTLSGQPELIRLQIEVQKKREDDVPFPVWEYYHLLRLRHKLPVFPIVLYLAPGAGGLTRAVYVENLFGEEIQTFRYRVVGLPDLSADAYREQENPLAPALSALMKSSRSGRALHKWLTLKRVAESDLDEARQSLLAHVIETYLPLGKRE